MFICLNTAEFYVTVRLDNRDLICRWRLCRLLLSHGFASKSKSHTHGYGSDPTTSARPDFFESHNGSCVIPKNLRQAFPVLINHPPCRGGNFGLLRHGHCRIFFDAQGGSSKQKGVALLAKKQALL